MSIEKYSSERPQVDILDTLWRTLGSPKFAAYWLALLIIVTALGSLFPQAPSELQANPVAYNRWLTRLAPLYRSQAAILKRVGAFSLYRTIWYRALWGVFALGLVVRVAEMLSAWRRERAIHLAARVISEPPAWSGLWGQFTSDNSLTAVLEMLPKTLHGRGANVITTQDEEHTFFATERAVMARRAILLLHCGAVAALVGIFLSMHFGWREPELVVGQGDSVAVGHDTDLMIRLDAVSAPAAPDAVCSSQLTLLADGEERGAGQAQPSAPYVHRGISFLHQECGAAIQATVIDAAGQRLLLRASTADTRPRRMVNLIFREQEELYFLVPAQDTRVHVRLIDRPSEAGGAIFFARIYRGEEVAFEGEIHDHESVEVGAARYAFEVGHYAVLQAVYAPALPVVLLGLLLICIGGVGIAVGHWTPPYRLWGRLTALPDKVHVQIVSAWFGHHHEARFYDWLERLQELVETEIAK